VPAAALAIGGMAWLLGAWIGARSPAPRTETSATVARATEDAPRTPWSAASGAREPVSVALETRAAESVPAPLRTGRVLAPDGTPVPGVRVTLVDAALEDAAVEDTSLDRGA